jgi:hypothetical protein
MLNVLAVIAMAMMPMRFAWMAESPTDEALTGAGVTRSASAFGGCLYRASESGEASFTVPAASLPPQDPTQVASRRRVISRFRATVTRPGR